MKRLHLSIITIIGIIVIAATSIGVFIEKLGENQNQPYAGITINGLKENYTTNEPIAFFVKVHGYGSGCGETKAIITKENDSQFQSPVWGFGQQCKDSVPFHNFEFNALPVNTSMNKVGTYILKVSFDDLTSYRHSETGMKFSVVSNDVIGITRENTFGINATVYHSHKTYPCPADVPCFNPLVYYMKVSAKSKTFLLNYNICDGNSCVNQDANALMLEGGGTIVRLPDLHWNDGDLVDIQVQLPVNGSLVFDKSSTYDPVHTPKFWVDLGRSKITPEY